MQPAVFVERLTHINADIGGVNAQQLLGNWAARQQRKLLLFHRLNVMHSHRRVCFQLGLHQRDPLALAGCVQPLTERQLADVTQLLARERFGLAQQTLLFAMGNKNRLILIAGRVRWASIAPLW